MAAPVQQQPASLEIDCTNSIRHPDNSANSMLLYETSYQRKRRRDQSACEDIKGQPSAKRRKAASHNYPPKFWNAISKITLTRRALKEFDRRTVKKPIPIGGAVKRSVRLLRSDTKQLKRLANNGVLNLNHLRGYAELLQAAASMSKSSSCKGKRIRDSGLPSSEFTTKTSTTGPYNSQFQQMLVDNNIYPKGYRMVDGSKPPKPNNVDSIINQLQRHRPSMSPLQFSETAFEEFQDINDQAQSESDAMSSLIPIIAGVKDRQYNPRENKMFNNLEKFAPGLRMAQPDKYYGARPEQVDERVRCDLSQYIVPSTSTTLPVAPNFFFEGKSAAGRPDVAQRQVMHDNAYGARAMFYLQNYGRETPVYDGNANTIGSTYHPGTGTLQIYATHPRQSATGGTEYHLTQLRAYAMTDTADSCRQGIAAYRNSRDFTQERRDQFIANANAIARSASTDVSSSRTDSRTGSSFAVANFSFESASTDELARVSSDESQRNTRPRKRASQSQRTTARQPRLTTTTTARQYRQTTTTARQTRSRACGSTSNAQASNSRFQEETDVSDRDGVTADGERDEDEDKDESGGDAVHISTQGGSLSDEAAALAVAVQRARQAQVAMARLRSQGHSKKAAIEQLVEAHQRSKEVPRQVAIGEVRAMLAFKES